MTSTRTVHLSFAGGELSPKMYGLMSDAKYPSGAARARNVIVTPTGPASRRPGTALVRETHHSQLGQDKNFRMIDFTYSATQALAIEMGEGYFRFHSGGAAVLVPGGIAAYKADKTFTDKSVVANTSGGTVQWTGASGTITTSAPHGLVTSTALAPETIVFSGTAPAVLVVGTSYYVTRISDTTFTVDSVNPPAGAITGGGNSAGHTLWLSGVINGIKFATAHGFATNDPIVFTSDDGGTLPGPLGIGSRYYAEVVDSTHIKVKGSPTTAVYDLTAASVGADLRLNYGYVAGDLVISGGTNYYCVQSPVRNLFASFVPGAAATYWHAQPVTGEYEVWNPFAEADLMYVGIDQENDVITMVHNTYGHYELSRLGATTWTMTPIVFGSSLSAPTSVISTAVRGQTQTITMLFAANPVQPRFANTQPHTLLTEDPVYVFGVEGVAGFPDGFYLVKQPVGDTVQLKSFDTGIDFDAGAIGGYVANSGKLQYVPLSTPSTNSYVVTAVGTDNVESPASSVTTVINNLFAAGSSNTISWSSNGAAIYRVYKLQDGRYGFLGDSETTSLIDDGSIDPDMGRTPPIHDNTLNTNYAGTSCHFEQRQLFARTNADQRGVYGTRSLTNKDMSYTLPITDEGRLSFRVRVRGFIQHLIDMKQLVLLTSEAEYRVSPVNTDVLTPTSFTVRRQSAIGSSHSRPVLVNNVLLFAAARGGHVREMGFNQDSDGFLTGDLSSRAAHLFDGYSVGDIAFSKAPQQIAWTCSSSGVLLGLTYLPEERIGAWHWHDTDGTFTTCCAIPDGGEDRVYLGSRRTINGVVRRFVERMGPQATVSIEDSFFVDCGLTGTVGPSSTISNLGHLEGKTVAVLANGLKQASRTVVGGQITLETPVTGASNVVTVGLPYQHELITLPANVPIAGLGQGRQMNVSEAWIRVADSASVSVGPSGDSEDLEHDEVTSLRSEMISVTLPPDWLDGGQVHVVGSDPLPLTVVSLTLKIALGG